jgi:hypothetical protein
MCAGWVNRNSSPGSPRRLGLIKFLRGAGRGGAGGECEGHGEDVRQRPGQELVTLGTGEPTKEVPPGGSCGRYGRVPSTLDPRGG